MNFGLTLKALRIRQGKSQAVTAAEISNQSGIHISQTYLSTLESRDLSPHAKLLNVLAEYYNVTPAYFIDYDVEMEILTRQIAICREEIKRLSKMRKAISIAKEAHQKDIGLIHRIKNRN